MNYLRFYFTFCYQIYHNLNTKIHEHKRRERNKNHLITKPLRIHRGFQQPTKLLHYLLSQWGIFPNTH